MNRSDWVELYERGYKLGSRERVLSRSKRSESVEPLLSDKDYRDAEIEALEAGYARGLEGSYPGADVDVKQNAHTAYDRSGYAASLSQWVRDE